VEEKKPVTDLFVALDLSSSMIQDDLKPNRITAAKKILSDFLDKVQNARVGLTVFARISFTQCPLTTDVHVVKELLSKADIFTVRLDGTAIGDALVSSLGRLQSGGAKPQTEPSAASSLVSKLLQATPTSEENKPNSQAIVLLTDGADNASQVDPLTAAKIAASRGVKIYTIGVGSRERVPALLMRPDGTTTFGIDPRTRQVMMSEPLNMTLLNEVARVTGGKSYAATDNHSLQAILDEIARLEKRDVTVTSHWEYQELAAYFLLTAFFILAVDIALGMTLLRTLP
jgi:Ca-activated chloride channel family protein